MSLNWQPSLDFLACSAHIGWAAACVEGAAHEKVPLWLTVTLFLIFTVAKEFWADLTWLEKDTFQGSCLDFITYVIGLALGIISSYWSFWLALPLGIALLITLLLLDVNGFFSFFARGDL